MQASRDAGLYGCGMTRRLAKLLPAELDAQQREVRDAITGGRRGTGPRLFRLEDDEGGLEGPFNAFLYQPRVGGPLQAVGGAIRFDTDLSDTAREVAILVVGVHWDSDYEWYAHEAVGRHVGLSQLQLEGIRAGDYAALPAHEKLVAETTRLLTEDGDLDDTAYAAAVDALGESGVFELTALVGYYATLALQLRVFRVGVPVD